MWNGITRLREWGWNVETITRGWQSPRSQEHPGLPGLLDSWRAPQTRPSNTHTPGQELQNNQYKAPETFLKQPRYAFIWSLLPGARMPCKNRPPNQAPTNETGRTKCQISFSHPCTSPKSIPHPIFYHQILPLAFPSCWSAICLLWVSNLNIL